MYDCGTIACASRHAAEITEEIISRVEKKQPEKFSLAQVTLDGLSREHGKGIDTRALASVREQLLDLKIRVIAAGEEKAAPLQQDVRAIDYLKEFDVFLAKKQLTEKQKSFVARTGREVLAEAMAVHREDAE